MDSASLYKRAYGLHYDDGDFGAAQELYERLLAEFPNSGEAGYARSQLEHLERKRSASMLASLPPPTPQASPVVLTTAPSLDGHQAFETLEIISAECVLGMNALKDALADLRDLFGGRSKGVQDSLKKARELCVDGLKEEARKLGADAVVGVAFSFTELGGRSMLLVVATGTAVRRRVNEGSA